MNLKVYLSSRWSRQAELRICRDQLVKAGIYVTSGWLDVDDPDNGPAGGAPSGEAARLAALEDVEDVLRASVLVAFSEDPTSPFGRGGRHVEFGIALGTGKRIVVVGPRENVFHWHPDVWYFDTWPAALDSLLSLSESHSEAA